LALTFIQTSFKVHLSCCT